MFKFNLKIAGLGIAIVLAIAIAVGLIVSSGGDETEQQTPDTLVTLTVSGSGSTVAVLQGIQARFVEDTPGYRLDILPGSGTGGGVQGVVEGILDIAGMARPPKDTEPVEYLEIGKSGQAFIVHPEVGVTELTSEQITAILTGEITNWSEVDGPDLTIIVYVRDEGDSTTQALRENILGDIEFSENAQVMTSQSDMISAVENTPGALGMCTWPAAVAMDAKVHSLSLNGISPSDSAYPVITGMGIGYLAENKAAVQALLDWLVSEEGQTALREVDLIIS